MLALALALLVAGASGNHQKNVSSSRQNEPFALRRIPRQQIVMSQHVVQLSLHVVVPATIEEYWCPTVEVEWGDGEASSIAPDCRPFAEATDEDRWELEDMYRFAHPYRTKGEHSIVVNISRNGKRIRQLKRRLEIR